MANEYRKFNCRICGKQLFAPVMNGLNGEVASAGFIELTCPSGHTDIYEIVETNRPAPHSASDARTFAAYAGIS